MSKKEYGSITKYSNVNLPKDVIRTIDRIVGIRGLGYTSRAEFVKDSIRKSIQELIKSGVIKGTDI